MTQLRDERGRFMTKAASEAKLAELAAACNVSALDLEGFILGSLALQEAKRIKAQEVADYWQSIAPVRGDHDDKDSAQPTAYGTNWADDYRQSIRVYEDSDGVIYVGSDLVPLADWLEYGSIHNPEHGYGAQTLAHFGGASGEFTHGLFVG